MWRGTSGMEYLCTQRSYYRLNRENGSINGQIKPITAARLFHPREKLVGSIFERIDYERRNQLHEVIRLSGMNLIIDDKDHPLIIKVASIQQARMQIYFIDNEDYFQRKFTISDKNEKFFPDNDERTIFFSRGVLETVKKLGWAPDIIHCHGWMTSLIPIYIKKAFKDNPIFTDTKVICSIYNDDFSETLNSDFAKKIKLNGITNKDLMHYQEPTYVNLFKAAIDFSDAVIIAAEDINKEVKEYLDTSSKPVLGYQPMDNYITAYNEFYDEILGDDSE